MNNVNQYQKVQVMTADGVQLIIMLYDGVIKFNNLAKRCIQKEDVAGRSHYITKSFNIISELANSLDMDQGGEVAENLARLYDFSINRLSRANTANDAAALDSVTRVINELKGGWVSIASKEKTGSSKKEKKHTAGVSHGA